MQYQYQIYYLRLAKTYLKKLDKKLQQSQRDDGKNFSSRIQQIY